MLEVVDVLLLPVEGEHVLVGPTYLLEALLDGAPAHLNLEASSFIGDAGFLVGRSIQHFLRLGIVGSSRSATLESVLVIQLERGDIYSNGNWLGQGRK